MQSEPDDQFLLRAEFQRGVALLDRFGMTYDILIFPRQLPAACAFADRNPTLRLVLARTCARPECGGYCFTPDVQFGSVRVALTARLSQHSPVDRTKV